MRFLPCLLLVVGILAAVGCDEGADTTTDDASESTRDGEAPDSDAPAPDGDAPALDGDAPAPDAGSGAGDELDGAALDGSGAAENDASAATDAQPIDANVIDATTMDAADGTAPGDAAGAGDDAGNDAGSDAGSDAGPIADAGPARCGSLRPSGDVLLDLGPTWLPRRFYLTEARIFSTSSGDLSTVGAADWMLWDRTGNVPLASGVLPCILRYQTVCWPGDAVMAGDLIVLQLATVLELRGAADGEVVGTIPFDSQVSITSGVFGIAIDGSYVWTAGLGTLETWSRSGQRIASRPGDYRTAKIAAMPGQLQVAMGPFVSDAIETISATTGLATNSPAFLGTFSSWFHDGARFITTNGTVVRIYSATAAPAKLLEVSSAASNGDGYGDYFWFRNGAIYQVSGGDDQVASLSGPPLYSEGFLLGPGETATLVDLHGASLVTRPIELPVHDEGDSGDSPFAATPSSDLALTSKGAMLVRDSAASTFQRLNCGAVTDIARSTGAVWAVALGDEVWAIDVNARSVLRSWSGVASRLRLSDDGAVLAWFGPGGEPLDVAGTRSTLKTFDVGSGQLRHEFGVSGTLLLDFDLAGDGSRVGQIWSSGETSTTPSLTITNLDGNITYYSRAEAYSVRLGPDTRFAVSTSPDSPDGASSNIYRGSSLTGSAVGMPVGWLDAGRLLMKGYNGQNRYNRSGNVVVDTQGAGLGNPDIEYVDQIDDLSGDLFYSGRAGGTIYNAVTGEMVWSAPPATGFQGAANDGLVLYTNRSQLIAEPR
jgi:hypothetical protein